MQSTGSRALLLGALLLALAVLVWLLVGRVGSTAGEAWTRVRPGAPASAGAGREELAASQRNVVGDGELVLPSAQARLLLEPPPSKGKWLRNDLPLQELSVLELFELDTFELVGEPRVEQDILQDRTVHFEGQFPSHAGPGSGSGALRFEGTLREGKLFVGIRLRMPTATGGAATGLLMIQRRTGEHDDVGGHIVVADVDTHAGRTAERDIAFGSGCCDDWLERGHEGNQVLNAVQLEELARWRAFLDALSAELDPLLQTDVAN